MAAAANRPQREIIEFPPNVPVTVALKFNQGKTISNQYGERMMFTTTDDRVMFLDLEPAGEIGKLGINVRENFTITKKTDGKKDSRVTWEIARTVGEQPNGTFVVPSTPAPTPHQSQQHRSRWQRPPPQFRTARDRRWCKRRTSWWTRTPKCWPARSQSTKAG